MTLSISQPHTAFSPAITPVENNGHPSRAEPDAAQNQMTDAGKNIRHTRATSEASSKPFAAWRYTDRELVKEVKEHFSEYAAGAGDSYVNFNELKEAAGLLPTTRTFSAQASAVAQEILKRKSLLEKLDIGIGFFGPGLKDERFDHDNLNYLIRYASNRPKVRFTESD
jgi:hypothetical protein